MLAIGLMSVVVRGPDVFGNILNKVVRQAAGTSPENNMWWNMCSKSLQMSSGICFKSSAIKPVPPAVCPVSAQLLLSIPLPETSVL